MQLRSPLDQEQTLKGAKLGFWEKDIQTKLTT
jgi:hypothetical protein